MKMRTVTRAPAAIPMPMHTHTQPAPAAGQHNPLAPRHATQVTRGHGSPTGIHAKPCPLTARQSHMTFLIQTVSAQRNHSSLADSLPMQSTRVGTLTLLPCMKLGTAPPQASDLVPQPIACRGSGTAGSKHQTCIATGMQQQHHVAGHQPGARLRFPAEPLCHMRSRTPCEARAGSGRHGLNHPAATPKIGAPVAHAMLTLTRAARGARARAQRRMSRRAGSRRPRAHACPCAPGT